MDKNTGHTRHHGGEELWVGDKINCRVYVTDRNGCYIYIHNAEVFYEESMAAFSIRSEDGNVFFLHQIVREKIHFVHKVPRDVENGTTADILKAIVKRLRAFADFRPEDTPEVMARSMWSEIEKLANGYCDIEELRVIFCGG